MLPSRLLFLIDGITIVIMTKNTKWQMKVDDYAFTCSEVENYFI